MWRSLWQTPGRDPHQHLGPLRGRVRIIPPLERPAHATIGSFSSSTSLADAALNANHPCVGGVGPLPRARPRGYIRRRCRPSPDRAPGECAMRHYVLVGVLLLLWPVMPRVPLAGDAGTRAPACPWPMRRATPACCWPPRRVWPTEFFALRGFDPPGRRHGALGLIVDGRWARSAKKLLTKLDLILEGPEFPDPDVPGRPVQPETGFVSTTTARSDPRLPRWRPTSPSRATRPSSGTSPRAGPSTACRSSLCRLGPGPARRRDRPRRLDRHRRLTQAHLSTPPEELGEGLAPPGDRPLSARGLRPAVVGSPGPNRRSIRSDARGCGRGPGLGPTDVLAGTAHASVVLALSRGSMPGLARTRRVL